MNEKTLETIELELAVIIRRTTSITTRNKLGNLDRSAYLLLQRIVSRGSAGVKTLADEFQLDISTVSRQAAALEQKGYVYRIQDPQDGRFHTYEITELGRKEWAEAKQARMKRVSELLQKWTKEEKETFGKLLKKYNQSFFE